MMKFNDKYNQEDFLSFLKDFLPEDFQEKEKNFVLDKSKFKKITQVKELGFCKSLDLYVLEIDHSSESDPRVAIATEAFKVLAQHWAHRALVIFKNTESENYRLSYLTISLDQNDKNKIIQKYSNARRYSFYLGTNSKVKTPQQQLVTKGRIKDIEDLLSRFSIEVVNKQFYLEVAKYFDELISHDEQNLVLPGVSQEDINSRKSFAVRLIGRIMFCWFLKQKKSESGQLIRDELLSSDVVKDGYYHSILEPLFFGVLNTSIDSRDIRSDLFDKVPYLNGGLFNPQSDDYYDLDRGTFVSKYINTLKISDSWFTEFFKLLETYNFTIDENTVFDQELSVDPEMLGRIFENLLAEINPETGSSDRKRTGSFYTPRQIVEYMVDQSLIEYLKTKTKLDEKKISALISYDLTDDADYPLEDNEKQEVINAIESFKILDPACGSGAYPIGVLQKIVYILQIVDPDCKLSLEQKLKGVPELYKQKILNEFNTNPPNYTRKLEVIKNSIFGVDIQPIAVDVSRLRCFLTLVVESEIDDTKLNRGIEPLPNLDFKFVCANTLIGLPKLGTNNLFEDHSGIAELSAIMSEYFTANRSEKESIKTRFFNKQKDLLNRMIELRATGELTLKLTLWDPFSNKTNSWFDPEWMFGTGDKFDVVIGNPPYGANIDSMLKEYKTLYPEVTKSYVDIYKMFFDFGFRILKNMGVLVFISPNTYLAQPRYKDLRSYLLKLDIVRLVNLGEKVFEEATVSTCVSVIKNQKSNKKYLFSDCSEKGHYIGNIDNLVFAEVSLKNLHGSDDITLLQKSESKEGTVPLETIFVLKDAGIKYQRSGIGLKSKGGNDLYERLFSENKNQFSNTVETWYGKKLDRYFLETNTDEYFNLDYKDILNDNEIVFYSKEAFNKKQKILWRQTSSYLIATIDEDGKWFRNTIQCGWLKDEYLNRFDLYYILGIFNSLYFKYLYTKIVNESAGRAFPQVKMTYLKKLPVMQCSNEKQKEVSDIAKKIIKLKKQNKDADTKNLEDEIDILVYKLYGLNEEEIKIVEVQK
jgi:adenine-specific DNA-methyltransferase